VLYGVRIRNINNPDSGDWCISNSGFYTLGNTGATSAIRIESSGGGKIVNSKINAGSGTGHFTTGIDIQGNGTTVDMQIANCSIENFVNTGILINGTAGNGWPNISIVGCEIGFPTGGAGARAIVASNTQNLVIDNIVMPISGGIPSFTDAIDLTNVTDCCITNITNGYINGFPTLSSGNVSRIQNSNIIGDGSMTLVQGWLNLAAGQTTQAIQLNMYLGPPSAGGFAAQYQGILIGSANYQFNGTAQTDYMERLSGGGAYWLAFAQNPDGSGTQTVGAHIAPLSLGGPTLATISGGTSGSAALGWINWGGEQRTAAATNYTNNTPTTIMSVPLVAGRSYSIDGYIPVTAGGNAGGVQVVLNASGGLTATAIVVDSIAHSNNVIVGQVQATTITTLTSVILGAATGYVEFHGTITVNAGGTLNIQTAQNTTNATTMTIGRGARIIVQDMP
jgi:hypothetical protein